MVAFATSFLVTIVMTGGVLWYARRRPVGAPLTWGSAMVAATYVFLLMFLAYGVVPHQWLDWADNELSWRADQLFLDTYVIDVTKQAVRDIIASGIYVVFLGAHIALWVLWQKRGEPTKRPTPTSAYGRPLVKEG